MCGIFEILQLYIVVWGSLSYDVCLCGVWEFWVFTISCHNVRRGNVERGRSNYNFTFFSKIRGPNKEKTFFHLMSQIIDLKVNVNVVYYWANHSPQSYTFSLNHYLSTQVSNENIHYLSYTKFYHSGFFNGRIFWVMKSNSYTNLLMWRHSNELMGHI